MKDQIIKLEEKLRLAMLNSDVAILDELIADSLIFTAPTGDIANKQMDLAAHKSGIQKMSKLTPLEQKIETYDNFAAVAVKMQIEGVYANNSIDGIYAYTRIWANLHNKWQIVAGHVSLIDSI